MLTSPLHSPSQNEGIKSCPQCLGSSLQTIIYDNVAIDACSLCGGFWFDKDELCQIVRQQSEENQESCRLPERIGERIETTELSCPGCTAKLSIYNLSEAFRFEAHFCEQCHGLWLEKGELEHAKLFGRHEAAMADINRKRTWTHWLFQFFLSLPVEFNIKPRRSPIVTIVLIVLCTAVFVCELTAPSPGAFLEHWALLPQSFPSPQWFITVITHQFLHGGIIHLLGNMYFLYILGDNIEDIIGWKYFLIFYLGCGVAGAVTYQFFGQSGTSEMVGASGAIAGVMAAYFVYFGQAKLTAMVLIFQFKIGVRWFFSFWLAINILGYILGAGKVAWAGHLGGFVCGLLIALIFRPRVLATNPILQYLAETTRPQNVTLST